MAVAKLLGVSRGRLLRDLIDLMMTDDREGIERLAKHVLERRGEQLVLPFGRVPEPKKPTQKPRKAVRRKKGAGLARKAA